MAATPSMSRTGASRINMDSRCQFLGHWPSRDGLALLDLAKVLVLGLDYLKGAYYAGTPCSTTHLVYMVAKGSVRVEGPDGARVLSAGSMLVAPAGQPHWVRSGARGAAVAAWFHLCDEEGWAHLRGRPFEIAPCPRAAESAALLERFFREWNSGELEARAVCQDLAEILLVDLRRAVGVIHRPEDLKIAHRLSALWMEVQRDPGRRWTVPDMAARLHVSPGYLHHLMKQHHGASPMDMVFRIRMKRAEHLLRCTDDKLESIAEAVGYRNASAFSEGFRRSSGQRPGEFRAQNRMA